MPTDIELLELAAEAAERAYVPYSVFRVGAAIVTGAGDVLTGANVENAAYPLCVCAERNAIAAAVSTGENVLDEIVVITRDGGSPCGACRQVMREFATDLVVWIADETGRVRRRTLAELLPDSFGPDNVVS